VTNAPDFAPDWIDELAEFLLSDNSPDDCLQISDLDGFLTGVAIGPELIMPSEWMPVIWQGEPDFKTTEQIERVLGAIMARYNEILRQLDDEAGAFEPIFYEAADGSVLATDWTEGFMDAVRLRADAWDAMFEDEDARLLIGPFMAHLHDNDGKPFIDGSPEEIQKIRDESAQSLPIAIKGIHDFWKARKQPANPTR